MNLQHLEAMVERIESDASACRMASCESMAEAASIPPIHELERRWALDMANKQFGRYQAFAETAAKLRRAIELTKEASK